MCLAPLLDTHTTLWLISAQQIKQKEDKLGLDATQSFFFFVSLWTWPPSLLFSLLWCDCSAFIQNSKMKPQEDATLPPLPCPMSGYVLFPKGSHTKYPVYELPSIQWISFTWLLWGGWRGEGDCLKIQHTQFFPCKTDGWEGGGGVG